jgi:hypothetical protein
MLQVPPGNNHICHRACDSIGIRDGVVNVYDIKAHVIISRTQGQPWPMLTNCTI